MKQHSLQYLRCIRCAGRLSAEVLAWDGEIEEGFLSCIACGAKNPVIHRVAVLWDSFADYIGDRPQLGGELLVSAKTPQMKSFLKKSLARTRPLHDRGAVERRWCAIYQNNSRSKFYGTIHGRIKDLAAQKSVLEHGCSIGMVSNRLAKHCAQLFGIDSSFYAIQIAKQNQQENSEYLVADSLRHPFAARKFDLVVCLNMLEIIEPRALLGVLSKQVSQGYLAVSDPYDFERGPRSVREPVGPEQLRRMLEQMRFEVKNPYKKPCRIPWSLKINSRACLRYAVDFVVAKKRPHLRSK